MVGRGQAKDFQRRIARERVSILFHEAERVFSQNPKRADRYVSLARKIAMKVNIHLSSFQRRKFCRFCYRFLCTGVNSRVRIRPGKIVITCLSCGKSSRIPTIQRRVSSL